MEKFARFKFMPPIPLGKEGTRICDSKEQRLFSREAAAECAVLLKNENGALPLKNEKIALFGMGAYDFLICGRGSGEIYTCYHQNFYDGVKDKEQNGKLSVYEPISDIYNAVYMPAREKNQKDPNLYLQELEIADQDINTAAANSDTAVIVISRVSGEGGDRKAEKGDYYLSDTEVSLVERVSAAFKKTVVILNVGAVLDLSLLANNPNISAILCGWMPGSEGGKALADLLVGDKNPSGRLTDTFTVSYDAYPGAAQFNADDLSLAYTEDIFVGYRYFETLPNKKEQVIYPFGYGLSYTSFETGNVAATQDGDKITVTATVKNTGDCAGKQVLQLYCSAPQGVLGKPSKQLVAFAKTDLLAKGDSQELSLCFDIKDIASYDDLGKIEKSAYLLEKGDYEILLGVNVRDTESVYTYTLNDNRIVFKTVPRCVPSKLEKRLLADGSFEALPQSDYVMDYGKRESLGGTAPAEQINFDKVGETISLKDFIAQLTDEELLDLTIGKEGFGLCNTACFAGNKRLDIPNVPTADGPAGIRLWPQTGCYTTCWPSATALASSWDIDLVYNVSRAAAMEAKECNFGIWLTPALNIHKDPLCGRNFEYFSEDPLISGKMAAAIVGGMQSLKISACIKHFACNNKEKERLKSDSRVSERALREIYLKGFEICVKESDPWSVMTTYNKLNGTYTPENYDLITGILRGEWGFKGMVSTDWDTLSNKVNVIKAGNDMIMPSCDKRPLCEALEKGELTRADLEACVERILSTYLKLV
ncbi:MAG: beta-glucosidase [Ruminococcaceae bacterium]|nr:beta-glucosidase [Oscillospiraceae bacterium]